VSRYRLVVIDTATGQVARGWQPGDSFWAESHDAASPPAAGVPYRMLMGVGLSLLLMLLS
jgi:hypothetical protein